MSDATITCPTCKTEIKLTESLAAPLLESTKLQYENQLAAKDSELAEKLRSERATIAIDEARKARMLLGSDLESKIKEVEELQEVLKYRDERLAEAQNAQAEIIRKERELDDYKREMDLNIEKRIQESLATVREKAKFDAEEGLKLKVAEKEETISAMQRQIEELRRKAEQGSQQLQGEVLEVEIESLIRSAFPMDIIEPVPKGEFGGDLIHRVVSPSGQRCGTILWESKRTKNWSDGWLSKLREDQRAANAEIAMIVSQVLPKDVESFNLIDGVWVTSPRCAIPVAITLRHSLIEIFGARQSSEGQQSKMELIYQYLTGQRFRHRIEAIVEKFSDMHSDLDKERKSMTRLWAKREEQIRCVIESTAGMYGDLQGIAGTTLLEIDGLSLMGLPEPETPPIKET